MKMDHKEVLAALKEEAKADEVHRTYTYSLVRQRPDGQYQDIDVTISDAGPDRPDHRWGVRAESRDGLVAAGNPGPDLITTIRMVHWYELDR